MATVKAAEATLETARTTVRQWQDKAAGARAEAAELDANSGALILADPAVADEISIKVDACHRRARAFEGAAQAAREQVQAATQVLLETHAADYDKQAAKARKTLEEHIAQVGALLDQLRELDGVEYVDGRTHFNARSQGDVYVAGTAPDTTTYRLHREIMSSTNKAAYIRYYAATGSHPGNAAQLRQYGGTTTGGLALWELMEETPAVIAQITNLNVAPTTEDSLDANTVGTHDNELDPVEDADILAMMGGTR
jgi:hypothetical protein